MLEQEITDFKGQGKANRTTLNLESGATENSLISHNSLVLTGIGGLALMRSVCVEGSLVRVTLSWGLPRDRPAGTIV